MKVSKAQVNTVLKAHGLANIKMQKNSFDTVTVKQDGKMVKGIELRSHSPMDCTSVPMQQLEANKQKVLQALTSELGLRTINGEMFYKLAETSRSVTYLRLYVERFPTYTRCRNLDNGYVTSYLVPHFVVEKK